MISFLKNRLLLFVIAVLPAQFIHAQTFTIAWKDPEDKISNTIRHILYADGEGFFLVRNEAKKGQSPLLEKYSHSFDKISTQDYAAHFPDGDYLAHHSTGKKHLFLTKNRKDNVAKYLVSITADLDKGIENNLEIFSSPDPNNSFIFRSSQSPDGKKVAYVLLPLNVRNKTGKEMTYTLVVLNEDGAVSWQKTYNIESSLSNLERIENFAVNNHGDIVLVSRKYSAENSNRKKTVSSDGVKDLGFEFYFNAFTNQGEQFLRSVLESVKDYPYQYNVIAHKNDNNFSIMALYGGLEKFHYLGKYFDNKPGTFEGITLQQVTPGKEIIEERTFAFSYQFVNKFHESVKVGTGVYKDHLLGLFDFSTTVQREDGGYYSILEYYRYVTVPSPTGGNQYYNVLLDLIVISVSPAGEFESVSNVPKLQAYPSTTYSSFGYIPERNNLHIIYHDGKGNLEQANTDKRQNVNFNSSDVLAATMYPEGIKKVQVLFNSKEAGTIWMPSFSALYKNQLIILGRSPLTGTNPKTYQFGSITFEGE